MLEAVAKANGLDIELIDSYTGRLHPDHTKASPLGLAPAFIGEDGYTLHELIAIAIYCTSSCRFVLSCSTPRARFVMIDFQFIPV